MKKKLLMGVVALMVLAGSAGAEDKPQYFSALQGIQAESLSNVEMEQTKGSTNWKLVADIAKMWGGLGVAMIKAASGDASGAALKTLTTVTAVLLPAYLDYKKAKMSEAEANTRLNNTMLVTTRAPRH